jgi:hypothetical protein
MWAQNTLRDIGIEFTTGDSYDFAWVAQASFCDKTLPLEESVNKGLEYLNTITGDYILLDGQDSHSLIGSAEILRNSSAILLLKNTLLKDWNQYKNGYINGRKYWGEGEYKVPDIDDLKSRIKLSGTNWVGTIKPQWFPYDFNKPHDVSCMFSWGDIDNYEFNKLTSPYYDTHRKSLLDRLEKTNYKVVRRERGIRIPQPQFYENMFNSKIIAAPIGYGEMAVRDIEAAAFGSILLKPSMDYLSSTPFIYEDGITYVACKYDWSDVEEKIDYILTNWGHLQSFITENMRRKFSEEYSEKKLAIHIHNIFKNLNNE